jgi:hypothetical protein
VEAAYRVEMDGCSDTSLDALWRQRASNPSGIVVTPVDVDSGAEGVPDGE